MALKQQQNILASFSMASMTDVVFLLLVFFMVTSTFIFPTAMEVNLPQSSEQTQLKPMTRVYVTPEGLAGQYADDEIIPFASRDELVTFLKTVTEQDPETGIAVYGDVEVEYGQIVDILNIGAENNLKMVLATTPRAAQRPSTDGANPQPATDGVPEGETATLINP